MRPARRTFYRFRRNAYEFVSRLDEADAGTTAGADKGRRLRKGASRKTTAVLRELLR
jgi:hypothetical protein